MYSIERRMLIVQLGVPVKVVLATDHDSYRKPSTQMWQYFIEHLNEDVQPGAVLHASLYDDSHSQMQSIASTAAMKLVGCQTGSWE